MLRPLSLVGALLVSALPSFADFQISPSDGLNHSYPTICRRGDGFVVAWESSGSGGREITIQHLDDDGSSIGSRATANRETTGEQQLPDIACRPDGSFLLVWESRGQDGDGLGIFARNFGADGSPINGEFQVNTYTTDNQRNPRVCTDRTGAAVIVWESFGQDGDGGGIYAQRLNPGTSGGFEGQNFQVNSRTAGSQTSPAIACSPDGQHMAAWATSDIGRSEINTARYDADGTLVDTVNLGPLLGSVPTDLQFLHHPTVASLPNGSFAIAYESSSTIKFGSLGIANPRVTAIHLFDLPRTGRNEAPVIATDGTKILAAWSRGTGFEFDIEAIRIDSAFGQLPVETRINSEHGGNNGALSNIGRGIDIAGAPNGEIVVWQRRDVFADDSTSAIIAQRFWECIGDCSTDGVVRVNELITAVRIALDQAAVEDCASIDADGNGKVEINELVRAVNEALAGICPAPAG